MIDSKVLLAVSDLLVVKALESVGKRIVSSDRSRYSERLEAGLPFHSAHTRWAVQSDVSKTLDASWRCAGEVLSRHGATPEQVSAVVSSLDAYTLELVKFRINHDVDTLARRLARDL